MLKLNKKLSQTQFAIFVFTLFISGLIFIAGSYFFLKYELYSDSSSFSKGPITSAPKTLRIELEGPGEDALFFESSVIVSGKTGPNLNILIMGPEKDFVIKSDPAGEFSTVLELAEGPNKIVAVVFDEEGDSRVAERNVYYSEEKI